VASTGSEMSFSVKLDTPALEWAGGDLNTVFGQRSNLLRPAFWRMLRDIMRFNRESVLDQARHPQQSLGDYLRQKAYGRPFIEWYLLPMAAAIWSCPSAQMLAFPLASFVAFCSNHGLLQVSNRPQWRTVVGGGREYVKKLAAGIPEILLSHAVDSIRPHGREIIVGSGDVSGVYDQIVLACHSDQSARLLANHYPAMAQLLAAIPYQSNRAVLHSDASLLPQRRMLWSAWNYQAGSGGLNQQPVAVNYLINRLQPLPVETPVIVSLNPVQTPDPAKVHAEFNYSHPVFSLEARTAQTRLKAMNGEGGVWLAGAWLGYGFHEDGLKSALDVARRMHVATPWLADAA
jgi:Predicted NAD/FAD-binding protein